MGRKSTYNDSQASEICERLSEGETLSQICRDEHMPSRDAVYKWIKAYPEFEQQIARARSQGFDALGEACIDIAFSQPERTPAGTVDSGDVQLRKMRVWATLELLKRWDPKRYGDRLELAGDENAPLAVQHTLDVSKLSTQALAELMAAKDAADKG